MHLKRCNSALLQSRGLRVVYWCTRECCRVRRRSLYTTRRRVRPVRLGPHGGREPPRPQKARHEGLSQVLPVQPLREQVHPNQCCRGKFLIVQHFCQHLNSISTGDIPRRSVRRIPKCSGQSLREVWPPWRRSRGTTCRRTRDQRRAPAWSA